MSKRLFTSPVKSDIPNKARSFGSPTNSSKTQFTGYIVQLSFYSSKSQSGNSFFEMLLKIGGNEYQAVRVMEKTKEREELTMHKSKPVKITVSQCDSTVFYNVMRGSVIEPLKYNLDFDASIPTVSLGSDLTKKETNIFVAGGIKWLEKERLIKGNFRVRKCLLKDESGEYPLSIWNNSIDRLKEEHWYRFSDIEIQTYYGIQLTCTRGTIIEEIEKGDIEWEEDKLKHYSSKDSNKISVCCPNVTSVAITETLVCPKCNQVVPSSSAEKIVKCDACGCKLNVQNSKKLFKGEMDIEKDDEKISLSFDKDVLQSHLNFGGDPSEYSDMEDALLLLDKVDITYDAHQMLLTDIKGHATVGDENEMEMEVLKKHC